MEIEFDAVDRDLVRESIFILGRVFSVEGRLVKIKLNKNKNHSHILYEGKTVKGVSVGSYVKVAKGFVNIIGKVEGEYISEEKSFNKKYNKDEVKINRILHVSLFGHFEGGKFRQGIKEMPLIDNECYLLSREEFNALHSFHEKDEPSIMIGSLAEEPSQEIRLSINKLFASHLGIFGNTGSGKSNTLAKIYTELFKECEAYGEFKIKSDFVIIDFNGEYIGEEMVTTQKDVYRLSTGKGASEKYPVSRENINKTEILSVLLEATEKTQRPFLDRTVKNDFFDDNTTYDQRVIQSIGGIIKSVIEKKDKNLREGTVIDLLTRISNLVTEPKRGDFTSAKTSIEENLHFHSTNTDYYWGSNSSGVYNNTKPIYVNFIEPSISNLEFKRDEFSKLKMKIFLNYFHEVVKGYSNPEHIGPLLGRVTKKFDMLAKLFEIGGEDGSHNLSVISLKNVNLEMKKVVPLIVCKQLYEKKKESDDKTSLHIIIDEAHNILSALSQRENEGWKDYRLETFEEIIKEGRKFGVFLTIASQRPFDISPTIISQLHNYFIHRLINDNDINAIEKAVSYLDKLSFQTIPILSIGSCFIAGLASDIPVKVDVDLLGPERRPKSATVNLVEEWGGI